jgi:hypothetical protein
MANQDPQGTLNYWYEGVSSSLIESTEDASIGTLNYWYNGAPQGFLVDSKIESVPRNFSILIGF